MCRSLPCFESQREIWVYCWARPEKRPRAKIVNDAIEAHVDLDVGLPEGPPRYLYSDKEECRKVLEQSGFDGHSMSYETRTVNGTCQPRLTFSKLNVMQVFAQPDCSRASRQKD